MVAHPADNGQPATQELPVSQGDGEDNAENRSSPQVSQPPRLPDVGNNALEDETGPDENNVPHQESPQSRQDNQQPRLEDVSVDADFDIDDNCDLVMSFKCRHCSFFSQDKPTLATHIRHRHVGGTNGRRHRHKSNHINPLPLVAQDDLENVGFDVTKIKMNKREIGKEEMPPIPSIPPTPEAFFIMSEDDEDEDSCQLLPLSSSQKELNDKNAADGLPRTDENHIHNDQTSSMDRDRDPLEMDDVFLCAECDIVFASKELCCRHMHDIHGLEQFSAEFIQEVIISRRPGEDGETAVEEDTNGENLNGKSDKRIMRKRIKPPKHLTLEEGALVPNKFRVSKAVTFFCSKCLIKYESEQVMKLHETCHIGVNEKSNSIPKQEHDTANRTKAWVDKDRGHDEEEDSMDVEVDPSLEEGSSTSNGQRKTNSGYCTQYKFKCPICSSTSTPEKRKNNGTSDKGDKMDTRTESASKVFTKWSTCASHLWREHQVDCELYSCTVCKKFKNYYITKVKDHERLHKPESSYICNICTKKFKQRHQLTTHQKYHKEKDTRLPPPSEARWYTPKECHICKRVLSDAKCLKKHISAVHKKLKPYCCNICGHMTARKAELRLHIRQHTNEKPFKCTHCPFVTGDHNSLRKHKLRHGSHRPYSCPYCEYRCIQSSAFKKHMVSIHPDQDVVFQCHICPHVSVNESVASAHLKDHEEGRIASTSSSYSRPRSQNDVEDSSSDRNGGPSHEDGNSSSSSNDYPEIGIRSFGRRRPPARKAKSPPKPRWLEHDDSVDVIDTGGVTIPAPTLIPVPPPCTAETELNSSSTPDNNKESAENSNPGRVNVEPSPSSSTNGLEELTTVNLKDIS